MRKNRSEQFGQLPLDELLLRLELAGFSISPADRLRIWRVLSGPAKTTLKDPRKLKYMLGPIIARGEAGQERFYGIFDKYMDEVMSDTGLEVKQEQEMVWWHWLLGIVTVVLLGWAIGLVSRPLPPAPIASFTGPSFGGIGDTVSFQNQSTLGGDTSQFKVYWEWRDAVTNELESIDSSHYNFKYVVPSPLDSFYQKKIVLRLAPRENVLYEEGNTLIAEQQLLVLCPYAPEVRDILGLPSNPNEKVDTAARLYLRPQGSRGPWVYEWDFGDGETATGINQYHSYPQQGRYTLSLSVTDTSAAGYCAVVLNREVNVGRVQAYASILPLQNDRQKPQANFSWGYWTLLSLLGIATLYYWARWFSRKSPTKPVSPEGSMAARFKVNDKAPYFIPFRSPDALLPLAPQQYRLAESMRHRQAGFRRGIDVPKTLKATIEKAGYPSVQFAFNTRPSEYLILVDEQSDLSHLGKLFAFVATSLRGQDVNADIYYYRRHFNRFWNKYVPDGLSAELLRRRYPGHRLLILGDAHDLLDPHAQGRPSLRKEYTSVLRQWPDRLLLTPTPPISWSYREKQLAHFCALYPADLDGLAEAAQYLEVDADPPSDDFKIWQAKQIEQRQDTDTEYRNWKRLKDHRAYLEAYPGLWEWFLALAVFPTPNWEMTIAIGHALAPKADLLTHDNLLRLARIPALQSGRWPSRLRREMLRELDPEHERIARAAIREELSAVRAETREGHAGIKLETELAIQDFALAPQEEEHQDTLRYLLQNNMLSPAQVAELDQIVQPNYKERENKEATKEGESSDIRAFLGTPSDEDDKPKKNPWKIHPLLWRAMAASFGFLLVFVVFWQLSGTDYLYNLTYGKEHYANEHQGDERLHHGFFVKENLKIDSAVIYNNYGVELTTSTQDYRITAPFQRALTLRNRNYPLAKANLLKSNYNTAAKLYNDYLNEKTFPNQVDSIRSYLRKAVSEYTLIPGGVLISDDSTGRDVQHLEGMLAYYEDNRPLAENYHEALSTTDYFDTLQAFPNLTTLLGLAHTSILSVNVNEGDDNATELDVNTFVENNPDDQLSLWIFLQGTEAENQSLPDTQRIILEGTGPNNAKVTIKPDAQTTGTSALVHVQIRDPEGKVLDTEQHILEKEWEPVSQALPTYRIRGQIVDADTKKGISNARVELFEVQAKQELKSIGRAIYTDAKGAYSISVQIDLQKINGLEITASAKNHERGQTSLVTRSSIMKGMASDIELQAIKTNRIPSEPTDQTQQSTPPQTTNPNRDDKNVPPDYTRETPEYRKNFSGRVVDAQTGVPIPWATALSPEQGLSRQSYPANQNGKINFALPASGLTQPLTYIFSADGYYPVRVSWNEMALKNKEEIRLQQGYTIDKLIKLASGTSTYSLCLTCQALDDEGNLYGSNEECFSSAVVAAAKLVVWRRAATNNGRQLTCKLMPVEDQIKQIKSPRRAAEYCLVEYYVNPSGVPYTRDFGRCYPSLDRLKELLPEVEASKRKAAENGNATGFLVVVRSYEKGKK